MMAYKIMLLLGDLYIDLSKEEIEKKIRETDFFRSINKTSRGIHPAIGWEKDIILNNTADELYFIKPNDIENYKNLRNSLGCLIVACDDDINYLERISRECNFSLIPLNKRLDFETNYKNSWSDVINSTKVEPINAAIITDNYLFNDKFDSRKYYSLFDILKSLIPQSLNTDFHLTIFYCNEDAKFTKVKANSIIKEIRELNLCKDMKVTIVSHKIKSTTHDRKILTNYHYIESGVGINNISKRGIEELATGHISSVFQSIDAISGHESKKHLYDYTQDWLKDIKDNHIDNTDFFFIAGDNINRLLDK